MERGVYSFNFKKITAAEESQLESGILKNRAQLH
jgi:hypothetical protein